MNAPVVRLDTPVVLMVYNRPDTTRRVFERVAGAQPRRLFIVADGPRSDRPDDARRCADARGVVATPDWPCDVRRLESDHNLGLKVRIESGLDWVFEQTDAAIVLEDDCVPDATFFSYAEALLTKYQNDDRIMTVSGSRFAPGTPGDGASYQYSRYPLIWGWATWRRAWQRYDGAMREWPEMRDAGWLESVLDTRTERQYWSFIFERNHAAGDRGTWDYAWMYSHWRHNGLAVHPAVNLVSNIGFGADSTHTVDPSHALSDLPTQALPWPLRHPETIVRDESADRAIEDAHFSGTLKTLLGRVRHRITRDR